MVRLPTSQPMCNMGDTMGIALWALVAVLIPYQVLAAWQDGVTPARVVTLDGDKVFKFIGNTTHNDHFKLLLPTPNSLLVGGRNVIYILCLDDLTEINRFVWQPNSYKKQTCFLKGGSEEVCDNYIRVLASKNNEGEYMICGTNAYDPSCADIKINGPELQEIEVQREYSGRGLCPFDYKGNSTSVYVDNSLYVGTYSDFAGFDPLIYKEPLRTHRFDLSKLNDPSFVKSFALGDYVYFFFRETAVEYMNCGKAVYSRVARVCRHDKGGPHKFKFKWTSFLKSRLNCSVGGDYPFYFDEIQATSDPLEGRYGDWAQTLVYGVFTTPQNSIAGSAVCAFSLQDIMDTYEGQFKGQENSNANWLPIPHTQVPEPRPGQCVQDSSILPIETVNFTKTHSLMDEAVPAFFGRPVLINTNAQSSGRFTSIAVDPQVRSPDGKAYDVLFIGTDNGKVIKSINIKSWESHESVGPYIIEELEVFGPGIAILSLQIIRPQAKEPRLLVTSSSQIQSIPLWRCYEDSIRSCRDCLALRDPHCVWDKSTQRCRAMRDNGENSIQSVASGTHMDCDTESTGETNQEGRTALHLDGEMVFDASRIRVNPGEKIHLNCGLNDGLDYRYCVWEMENLPGRTKTFQVDDVRRQVYNGVRSPRQGRWNDNQCGIRVDRATFEDGGTWTCKIFVLGKVYQASKTALVTGAAKPSTRAEHFAP